MGKKQGVEGKIYHRDKQSLGANSLYHLCKIKRSVSASPMLYFSVVALTEHGVEGDVKGWGLENHVKLCSLLAHDRKVECGRQRGQQLGLAKPSLLHDLVLVVVCV